MLQDCERTHAAGFAADHMDFVVTERIGGQHAIVTLWSFGPILVLRDHLYEWFSQMTMLGIVS